MSPPVDPLTSLVEQAFLLLITTGTLLVVTVL